METMYVVFNPLWPDFALEKPAKMGPIVIYKHVNTIGREFKLDR